MSLPTLPNDAMKRNDSERSTDSQQKYDAEFGADTASVVTVQTWRSRWAGIRSAIREPAAEFIGTMILVIFGCGVNAQVTLSHNTSIAGAPTGDWLSISFGWAAGIALAVWVCGGISGGHINPAVTLALAVFRGFPWKKVPVFIIAQNLGALCGAALVYANYYKAIGMYEGGTAIRTVIGPHSTAGFFGTYAADFMTNGGAFFNEFLSTLMFVFVILAITDQKNAKLPPSLDPLVLFIAILGISACLGMETGFALNPARDFGPRLFTLMAGYGGEVFNYRSQYWLWCACIAPILGAMVANLFYDLLFFEGPESIINSPRSFVPWLNHNLHAPHGTTHIHVPIPAGVAADSKVPAIPDVSALV